MRIKPKSNVWTPISRFRKVNSNPSPKNILVDPGWTAFLSPSVPFFEGKLVFQKQNTQIMMFERHEALNLREPPSLYLPRPIFLSKRLCLKRWIFGVLPKVRESIFFFSSLIFIFSFAVFLFTNIQNSLTCFTFFSSWTENCVWFKKKTESSNYIPSIGQRCPAEDLRVDTVSIEQCFVASSSFSAPMGQWYWWGCHLPCVCGCCFALFSVSWGFFSFVFGW